MLEGAKSRRNLKLSRWRFASKLERAIPESDKNAVFVAVRKYVSVAAAGVKRILEVLNVAIRNSAVRES